MKRVIIVRHAKSVPYGYDDDFHRDLKDRGEVDAGKIARSLKDNRIIPDLIISSPATRALHTARIFAEALGYKQEQIRLEEDLYEGVTTQDFVDFLKELSSSIETVMVVGHNPTVYYFVSNLVKYFNSDMPTCSTVAIDFHVDLWNEIEVRTGHLAFQYVPKMFKQ